jgi:hypothetical protein
VLLDRFRTWGLSDAPRHDEGRYGRGLGNQLDYVGERLLELQDNRLVILRLEALCVVHQHLAGGVTLSPAVQRRHHVRRGNRLSIVELQAVAKGEGVGQLVIGNLPVCHLWLRFHVLVDTK